MYRFKGFIKIKALLTDGQHAIIDVPATYTTARPSEIDDITSMDLSDIEILDRRVIHIDESEREVGANTFVDDWTDLISHSLEYDSFN